ncbi:MAG: TetR/AcrR family transcriptional regulator [Phycisphaerae bacterium]|jgi:AcrR family transcriptional regulator
MTAEKISTKQKIADSAKNLFSTHGFCQTSLDDIITAAGITKGAFYHYFKSKEAICQEIIDSVQIEYHSLFEALPKNQNPLEQLKAIIAKIVELNNSGQWVNCELMFRLGCQMQTLQTPLKQKIESFWKWLFNSYLSLITQCRELKLISDKLSAEQQAKLIIDLLTAATWRKTVFDDSIDAEIIDYVINNLK